MKGQELNKKSLSETKKNRKMYLLGISNPNTDLIDNPVDLQVFELLSERGGMTLGDLIKITKIPRSTLHDSLTRLQLAGLVDKFTKKSRTRIGRPLAMFESILNTTDQ